MWKCCTKTNSDYYQPFLMAKKAVEEENSKELVALSRKSQAFSEASRGVIEVVFMFTGRSQQIEHQFFKRIKNLVLKTLYMDVVGFEIHTRDL